MAPLQLWIKSRDGRVFGPLSAGQIGALHERKQLGDPVEVSEDGERFEPIETRPTLLGGGKQPVAATPPSRQATEPAPAPVGGQRMGAFGPPPSGRLEEVSPFQLYFRIGMSDATGRLTLGEGPDEISVWFKQGAPHAAASPAMELAAFLVAQGVLSAAVLEQAKGEIMSKGSGDLATGLFAVGLLNPATGFQLIQQHAQAVLQRGLLMEQGPFAFDGTSMPPASGFPLGSRWQLLAAAARRLDPLSLRRRLTPVIGHVPRLAGSTAELQLTAQETRILALIDGQSPLAAVIANAGALGDTLQRLAVLLGEIGRLTWEAPVAGAELFAFEAPPPAPPAPAPAPAPAPKPPAAPAPAASPAKAAVKPPPKPAQPVAKPQPAQKSGPPAAKPAAPAPSPPIDVKALKSLLEALTPKDLFARLGFQRTPGTIPTLKAVYFQLAKLYHPDTVPPDAPVEARQLKEQILSLYNEAYGVLENDKKRKEYFDDLEAREQVGDLDVVAILNAEEDFQQATVLARGRKFTEALAILESCVTLNPKEGEFYAWIGYCRFFGAQDKRAVREAAVADMRKALVLSPRCAVAWLFQGHVAKLLDDVPAAKEAYGKVLELEPRNSEAQRELRLFASRKQ